MKYLPPLFLLFLIIITGCDLSGSNTVDIDITYPTEGQVITIQKVKTNTYIEIAITPFRNYTNLSTNIVTNSPVSLTVSGNYNFYKSSVYNIEIISKLVSGSDSNSYVPSAANNKWSANISLSPSIAGTYNYMIKASIDCSTIVTNNTIITTNRTIVITTRQYVLDYQ